MKDKKPSIFPLYVNGQYAQTSTLREVNDPLERGEPRKLCFIGPTDGEIVEAALEGARLSFEQVRAGFFPLHERLEFLKRLQAKIEEQSENLASLLVQEIGKPIALARQEVQRCLTTLEWTRIEAARFFDARGLPVGANRAWEGLVGSATREGKGPLLAISPFNFPLNLSLHKIAPAIAAGCPVIFKPSSKSALTALTLVDFCHAAGLPPGMLSMLNTENELTAKLVQEPRIRLVSFTGSAPVGFSLAALAQGRKDVFLELGGSGPAFVDASADLDLAASKLVAAGLGYAGQVCIALQNLHVHESVYDRFRESVADRVRAYAWGDPRNESLLCGPVIDLAAAEKIEKGFERAVHEGARVVATSEVDPQAGANRRYVRPRLLEGVSPALAQAELFGPGIYLHRVASGEGFLAAAAAYPARFQASLFTADARFVQQAYRALDYGAVLVNEPNSLRLDPMPFGGNGEAGNAREGPAETLAAFTQAKTLVWRP